MDRGSKFILRKIVIDFVILFVMGMTILGFFLFGQPYKRGFFCNDESLTHPYVDSTVTSLMLYVTGLVLPICTMLVLEYVHSRSLPDSHLVVLFGRPVPNWMLMAYTKIGMFGFGAAASTLTTDIAKYTIGRLRPHFMTLCRPNVNCSLPENMHRYIEDFTCTNMDATDRLLKELRLSFPSGHSSFSAYTMISLALYLQLRMTWKGSKLLRHFLQFVCIIMAWFTAMTRISNYKHHWSDVLAGSAIGTAVALITTFALADIFKEKRLTAQLKKSEKKSLDSDKHVVCSSVGYEVAASSDGTLQQVNNGAGNHIC